MARLLSSVLLRLFVLSCGAGVLVACAGTPSPQVPAAPAPIVTPVDAPPGSLTCGELTTAVNGATLMDPGVVDAIVRVSSLADAPLADSARRLAAAYAAAVTAHGSDSEPDAIAAVSAAGADLTRVCTESGLDTVG
jgi:hypothetical protein